MLFTRYAAVLLFTCFLLQSCEGAIVQGTAIAVSSTSRSFGIPEAVLTRAPQTLLWHL